MHTQISVLILASKGASKGGVKRGDERAVDRAVGGKGYAGVAFDKYRRYRLLEDRIA